MPDKKNFRNKSQVYDRCGRLESHVRSRDLATDDELEEYRPAEEEDDATKTQWWLYLCQLHRFLGREHWMPKKSDEAESEVLKALKEEPEPVHLLATSRPGEVTEDGRVLVYPKGLDALMWLSTRDTAVEWLAQRKKIIEQMCEDESILQVGMDNPWETVERISDEISYQLACMAYAVTREGAHFDGEDVEDPPEEWLNIDPVDIMRIHRKHVEVNAERLSMLPYLTGPGNADDDSDRASWSVFISTAARQQGRPAKEVARDQSLASLLAQINLSSPQMEDLNE